MYVGELMLEVTRKCNLKCEHCLRGNAQNKSMTTEVINAVFRNIKSVDNLIIGGGEPSLAVDVIDQIYQHIIWNDVTIENIFIVTNGKRVSKPLLQAFDALYGLCEPYSEISGFAISNDEFHERARGFYRNIEDYRYLIEDACYADSCEFLNINEYLIQEHTNKNSKHWLARGRAKDFGDDHSAYLDSLKINDFENPTQIHGQMYICYNGDVVGDQNMAYNDMKKYVRGNVLEWAKLIDNLKQSTIDNYNWCLNNCKHSSPDPDETDYCNEWYSCEKACNAIKKLDKKGV